MTPCRAALRLSLLIALAAGAPLSAQSTLAAGGLGMPIDPADGRARALGSNGAALFGSGLIPGDPVSAADLPVPTVVVTGQSAWLSIDEAGGSTSVSGNRFPALGVSYPVRTWGTLTLTYGAVLDQRWDFERRDTLDLTEAQLEISDRFTSDGGVSALRVGFAHRVSPSLAVGVAVGAYTGNSTRVFTRVFDTLAADVDIEPFQSAGRWKYSGATASLGLMGDLGALLRAAVTLTWSGDLDAEPGETTAGGARTYSMPLELRAGLSGALAPDLNATVSYSRSDWSDFAEARGGEEPQGGVASFLGGGLEWEGGSLFGRAFPVRAGWHRATLPFEILGAQPKESAFSFGAGLMLLEREDGIPLALVDLGLERGSREAATLDEGFWRSTLSVRVAGF